MLIIVWLIFGGIAGWLASILTKQDKQMGLVANILVGIMGSIIGGWLASLIGLGTFNTFSIGGLLIAVGGAVVLIYILNVLFPKR